MKKWPIWWKHIYSKLVIIIGFGIFYFENLGQLGLFFRNMFGISSLFYEVPFADQLTWGSFQNNLFLILVAIACSLPLLPKIKEFFLSNNNDTIYTVGRVCALFGCLALLIISSILLVDATNNPFLYFRF